jgi:predicted outer membrane repeat protein
MRGKANHVRSLLCALFLLAASGTATAGRVIYVDARAIGADDGSSWTNAFNYLQDAITTASAGDEIRVAQGVYTPDHGAGITPGDREATFQLINGVTLAGGYAGFGGPDPNARNVELYETILSGDLEGNDVDVNDPRDLLEEPTYNDNSHHIVTSGGNGPDTIIDGFIISHGNGWGSGIRITSDGPTILNCTFKYNSGSAIDSRQSNLRLNECSFVGNQADSGGGVWSWGNAVLTSCVFRNNSARNKGGAVAHNGGVLELIDCEFVNNSVSWSSSHYDGTRGGALWAGTSEKVVIQNCIFNRNAAPLGGAIRGYGNGQIDNCVFTDNLAEYGGALFGFPDSTIENCIFSGNRAVEGGALCTDGWGPNLINCTLADNWAQNSKAIGCISPGRGGRSLVMTITNCILWNGFDEIRLNEDKLRYITITHTNIQGGWPSWPWQGIIYSDPCFAKPGYWIHANDPNVIVEPNDPNAVWIIGDYHLKSQAGRYDPISESWAVDEVTSPCIDAGDPNSPVAFEPRPNGSIVNMGAYGGTVEASKSHFDGFVCNTHMTGDINADCKVDLVDLIAVIAQWTNGVAPILEERPLLVVDQPRDGATLEMSGETILIRGGVYDPNNSIVNVSIHVYGDSVSWNTRRGAIRKEPSDWPVEYLEWEWDYDGQYQMGPGQYTIIVEAIDDERGTLISPEVKITLLE